MRMCMVPCVSAAAGGGDGVPALTRAQPRQQACRHAHRQESRAQAAAQILGREGGRSVSMLVHHSRNSEQKQWDETLVLAVAGMGRLLRAHLATIVGKPAFPHVRSPSGSTLLDPDPCAPCLVACVASSPRTP